MHLNPDSRMVRMASIIARKLRRLAKEKENKRNTILQQKSKQNAKER
jgi:hypothetical protein